MRIVFYILVVLSLGCFATRDATALECGVPEAPNLGADTTEYCDIHQRRLAYKDSRDEFRGQVQTRRENYIAPALEARKVYDANVQSLHNQAGDYNQ
jgi:hypothetical protein